MSRLTQLEVAMGNAIYGCKEVCDQMADALEARPGLCDCDGSDGVGSGNRRCFYHRALAASDAAEKAQGAYHRAIAAAD